MTFILSDVHQDKLREEPKMAIELPITSEMRYGRGYESSIGLSHATAIQFDPATELPGAGGKKIHASIEQVTTSKQLSQRLGVTASLSYKGVFSASAEAEYLRVT